jgi:hypothetical protein
MGKSKYLETKARARINQILDLRGEISMDEAVKIIMPHLIVDYQDLRLELAKRVARSIMAARKDTSGVRSTFATKRKDNSSVYIDLDTCKNLKDAQIVERQLYDKRKGIIKSHQKAKYVVRQLEGQISMAEIV